MITKTPKLFRKFTILALVAVFFIPELQAQNQYKVYTGFLYHFIKYTQWPSPGGDVVIGVLGKSGINSQVAALNGKAAGSSKISIKEVSSVADVSGVSLLFIPKNMTSDLSALAAKAKSQNILLVTESTGATKNGSVINFYMEGSNIKFEISGKNASSYGLKISSDLLRLAKVVD